MDKVKVGIVGLGSIAKKMHIPILSSFGDVEIISAAELNSNKERKFAEKWNIGSLYDDYEKMYDEVNIDSVFICLPNFLHYKAVKSALNHNINVFCEKPMGINAEEAYELVSIAKDRNLILAVGYNRKLEAKYKEAAHIVKESTLGNILQINATFVNPGPYAGWIPNSDWFFKDKYGVLYDSGPHLIDLIMHVLSDQITEVFATGISTMHGIKVYDNIVGFFKTEKGTIGTFNLGWKIATNYDSIQIHGTGGSVLVTPFEVDVRYANNGPLEKTLMHMGAIKEIVGTQVRRAGEKKRPNDTYTQEDRALIDAILQKGDTLASGLEALRVLEILDAIKQSLDTGNIVRIDKHEMKS